MALLQQDRTRRRRSTGTRQPRPAIRCVNEYVWQSPGKLFEHQPTVRIDYNLTDKHRLSGSYAIIWAERDPDYLNSVDARFPGAPNYRFFRSTRPLHSLRAALDAVGQQGQRGARRHHRQGRLLEVRIPGRSQRRAAELCRSPAATRSISRLRCRHRAHQLARHQRSELAQRADLQHRRVVDLAEGQAQLQLRRRRSCAPRRGRTRSRSSRRSTSASAPTTIRRGACSTPPTSRTRPPAQLTDARDLYALLTGRVSPRSTVRRRSTRTPTSTSSSVRAGAKARSTVLRIRAGLVAHEPDGDADRRPPLRRADAVLRRQQHDVDGHDGRHLRHLRPR